MKVTLPKKSISIAAPFVLCASMAMAGEQAGEPRVNLLDNMDLFAKTYEKDDNVLIANDSITKYLGTIHKKAAEARLSFYLEQAFNQSWVHNPVPDTHSQQTWYLIHGYAAFNLIESSVNQGTWIKAELSGSSALSGGTHNTNSIANAFGASSSPQSDVFEDGLYYLPEILVSQGFCKGKGVLMVGIVGQTNYFDMNAYANNSFGQFTNAAFVNSRVMPLIDGNLGAILQGQLSDSWYVQLGSSMTDNGVNQNPFKHTRGKSFNVVGEVGWVNGDVLGLGSGTYRIQPFMFHNEGENARGGIALNFQQDLGKGSPFAVFSRTGWSQAGEGNINGASFQASGGLIFKKPLQTMGIMNEGDRNFLGLAFSVAKPDGNSIAEGRDPSKREYTLECTYNFGITRFLSIQPTFQYVFNPAQRSDTDGVSVFAIQTVLNF